MKTLKEFLSEEFNKSIESLEKMIKMTKDKADASDFSVVLKAISSGDFKAAAKKVSNMDDGPGDMIIKLVAKSDGSKNAIKIFGKGLTSGVINEAAKIKIKFKDLKGEIEALSSQGKAWRFTNKKPNDSNKSRYLESAQNQVNHAIKALFDKIKQIHPEFKYPEASGEKLKFLHMSKNPSPALIKKIVQAATDDNEQ